MRKGFITSLLAIISVCSVAEGFENPVLPGYYPDPSVCRVGDYFYVVNSSFQYFPGVPIHRSKDLIHWQPIGHVLDRRSQLELGESNFWGGIYAPTIRHHDGTFYMVTTNCSGRGNFYVTSTEPSGPWSEPIWVDQGGIDPDLFFDGEKVYFLSAVDDCITQCQIDIATGNKLTPSKPIWRGCGGRFPEAPHMYSKDGYYYLLIAEGGTEYGHRATIARSQFVDGPFEANPANPILTHMNRNGENNPIQGTGHADLVQAEDGSWWMMCLGFRPQSYTHHVLGRETFLSPVRWDDGAWPVVNGDGTIALQMQCPTLQQTDDFALPARNEFKSDKLGFEWQYLCNPDSACYSLTSRRGFLRLTPSDKSICHQGSPTFVGRRQQHINFDASTALDVKQLTDNSAAGLAVYMGHEHHYTLAVKREGKTNYLELNFHLGLIQHTAAKIAIDQQRVVLKVTGTAESYAFSYSTDGKNFTPLAAADTRFLSSETAGGFTGVMLGLYTEGDRQAIADFDWFEYVAR